MLNDNTREHMIRGLFQYYHKELTLSARKRLPTSEDAEDVVDDVWYMATMKADSLYEHPNKIAWLYTALDLCIRRFYAKKQREVLTVPLDDSILNELAVENDEMLKNDFDRYKNILTDLEWKYIQYRFNEDLSNEEIARKENKSYSSITSLGNRVRKKIKNFFKAT